MIYALLLWTAVVSNKYDTKYDWRELSSGFQSVKACQVAAEQLGIRPDRYRCVSKQ